MRSFIHTTLTTFAKLCSCMLLLTLRVAAGPVDDLKLNFETRRDFAAVDRDQQLTKLDASYLAALDRQIEKTKATGKLEAVIPLVDEVQAIKAAKDPLPELPQGVSPELKLMRAKHSEARAKILKSHADALTALVGKMQAALKSQEAELTKVGKIDEAVAVKQMRESLEKDGEVSAAKELIDGGGAREKPGDWRSLLEFEMIVQEKGHWETAVLSKSNPDNKPFMPLVEILKKEQKRADQILMAIPNSIVEFNLPNTVTQIRGKMTLKGAGGSVHFKVFSNDLLVAEKIIRSKATEAPFEVQFPPTKKIRLETDQIENDAGDWSAWMAPEVR